MCRPFSCSAWSLLVVLCVCPARGHAKQRKALPTLPTGRPPRARRACHVSCAYIPTSESCFFLLLMCCSLLFPPPLPPVKSPCRPRLHRLPPPFNTFILRLLVADIRRPRFGPPPVHEARGMYATWPLCVTCVPSILAGWVGVVPSVAPRAATLHAGAALREFWGRSGSGVSGPACIRDFDVVDTLGHGDYGSVFEVRWCRVQC
jgi:hypothetical protein